MPWGGGGDVAVQEQEVERGDKDKNGAAEWLPERHGEWVQKEQRRQGGEVEQEQSTDLPDAPGGRHLFKEASHVLQGLEALVEIRLALTRSALLKMVGNLDEFLPGAFQQNLQQDFIAGGT